ncbi:hypothetical protein RSAG8_03315, partial [Rhizoctonia solani AG-8 WAC10335]
MFLTKFLRYGIRGEYGFAIDASLYGIPKSQLYNELCDRNIIETKCNWLSHKGLAGAMFWELSGDKNGTDSLVWTAAKTMRKLDNTENHLNYPGSQFDNVKAGMKITPKRRCKVKAPYS